jgi:hemolysin activation/secretion protein
MTAIYQPAVRLLWSGTLGAVLVLCGAGAAVAQAPAAPQPRSAEAGQARFDILEYRVLGNTSLATRAVEQAVYPHLGPNLSIADVEAARQSLEKAYRDAGFGSVYVDIPEQQVDAGIVRLRVTEGHLDRIHITGARYFSNGQIRAALPALTPGKVLNVPELQAQLTNLNRVTPDRVVTPILKAGQTPGTVDVDLQVNDTLPVHASLDLNNRYTAGTPQLRLTGQVSYSNLFDEQQSASIQYQVAPENVSKVNAVVGSYVFRVPSWTNTSFAVYAVDSDSKVAAIGTLSVIGTGQIFGTRIIETLTPLPNYTQSLTFGVDYKDFLENILITATQSQVTPVHYLNWTVSYAGTLSSPHSTTDFTLAANLGIRGLVNTTNEFANKRFEGEPDYFYIRASVQHLQKLPWGLQLFGSATGQATEDPLVSNEQLAVGGADTVRGYLEADALGDYGAYGTLELRQDWPARFLHVAPNAGYVLAFCDSGVVNIFDALPGQASRQTLAGCGAGFRFAGWHGLDLSFDWARALITAAPVYAGDSRLEFDVRYGF